MLKKDYADVKDFPNEDEIIILADAEKLKIALLNIIINAIEAMEPEIGKLSISLKNNGQGNQNSLSKTMDVV